MTGNPFDIQEFREELTNLLDKKLTPITDLVTKHEAALNRSKGAMAALVTFWTMLVAFAEWFFHRK